MRIYSFTCRYCGTNEPTDPIYPNFYVCNKCKKPIGYYCEHCSHFYEYNNTIKNGDLYICMKCGQPHFGFTKYKQVQAERQ